MSQTARLSIVLGLNLGMIAALVIVGRIAHSIGVLAAGGDYLADSAAICFGLVAIRLRDRAAKPHATAIAAAINATLLLTISILVIIEASRRLLDHASMVDGLPVLVVSGLAALVMTMGALVLVGEDEGDLHMRSVILDTIADAASAAAVAIAGAVIYLTHGLYWLDPLLAAAISSVIAFQALRLLQEARRA